MILAADVGASNTLPLPSEAGHADFAPNNEVETELLRYLRDRFHHVSWDRVLSGPGLLLIYEFFRDTGGCIYPKSLATESLRCRN
ncbi:MAG: glucokinase [Terriglobia bacterium]|nr:glucokinase [Terriglobia bacterium]